MNGDDDLRTNIFDVFGGVGNFGPRGRNWNTKNFGVLDGGLIERIARIDESVINNYTEIVTRNLPFDNGGMRLTEELDFEIAYFPGLARADDDRATDKGCSVGSGVDRGRRIGG